MSIYKKSNPERFATIPTAINSIVGGSAADSYDGTGSQVKNTASGTWLDEDDASSLTNILIDQQLLTGANSSTSVTSSSSIDARRFSFNEDNSATINSISVALKSNIGGSSRRIKVQLFHDGSSVSSVNQFPTSNESGIRTQFSTISLTSSLTGAQIKDDTFIATFTFEGSGSFPFYWAKLYPVA